MRRRQLANVTTQKFVFCLVQRRQHTLPFISITCGPCNVGAVVVVLTVFSIKQSSKVAFLNALSVSSLQLVFDGRAQLFIWTLSLRGKNENQAQRLPKTIERMEKVTLIPELHPVKGSSKVFSEAAKSFDKLTTQSAVPHVPSMSVSFPVLKMFSSSVMS